MKRFLHNKFREKHNESLRKAYRFRYSLGEECFSEYCERFNTTFEDIILDFKRSETKSDHRSLDHFNSDVDQKIISKLGNFAPIWRPILKATNRNMILV